MINSNVKLFFDEEQKLFGIKPINKIRGYSISVDGRIRCRTIPEKVESGIYHAEWNKKEKMIIVDLNKTLNSPDI